LGALTPVGLGVEAYWEGLKSGRNGAGSITRFDARQFRTKFACELKGFDVKQYIPVKEARKMDAFSQYMMITAEEALQDAKLLEYPKLDKDRVGVVLGSGIGGIKTFQEEIRDFTLGDGTPRFNPFFVPKMIIDIIPGLISIKHGFAGPNYAVISACATSTNCLIDSYLLITNGLADVVITGGSEAAITEGGIGGFNAMRALSERNDSPETASRPFDAQRDGFVLGEGSGSLILETLEHAEARGAKIYAELVGIGLSADAFHLTAPHDEGAGVAKVMRNALQSAGLPPESVDYINLHGTSTPLGDVAETKAVKAVFGEHAYRLNLSSCKSMIGHLLGAAGAVEAIATVLSVYHDVITPTINHFEDDPLCDLNYTFHQLVERPVQVALTMNYGFGGHNAALVFTKFKG
jgi:3-oxoacyl-[acyl-carrier-protein] synthase II